MNDDRYRLLQKIDEGGQGVVWLAEQMPLGREVVVKILHADGERPDDPLTSASLSCFRAATRAEAIIGSFLDHPNIVPIYDLFERTGPAETGLVMKRIRGEEWGAVMERERGTLAAAAFRVRHVEVLRKVAQAVAFAHARGIVHRDLKPAQVVVCGANLDEVYLCDWGHAAIFDTQLAARHTNAALDTVPSTRTDVLPHGTASFRAPEQERGEPGATGPWTDVYLLGGILFQLLTGRAPHGRDRRETDIDARLAELNVPSELRALTIGALHDEPARRIESAEAFAARLALWSTGYGSSEVSRRRLDDVRRATVSMRDLATFRRVERQLEEARASWPDNPAVPDVSDALHEKAARIALEQGDLASCRDLSWEIVDEGRRAAVLAALDVRTRRARLKRRLAVGTTAVLALALVVSSLFFRRQVRDERALAEAADYARTLFNVRAALDKGQYGEAEEMLLSAPAHLIGWEWGHLFGTCHRERLLIPMPEQVTFLAVDENRERAIVAQTCAREGVHVLRPTTLETIAILPTDAEFTLRFGAGFRGNSAVSPSGRWLAGIEEMRRPVLYDASTGNRLREFPELADQVHCLRLAEVNDAPLLFVGTDDIYKTGNVLEFAADTSARVWNALDGTLRAELRGHTQGVTWGDFDPAVRRVATSSRDGTARVWSLADGTCDQVIVGHTDYVWHVAFDPTGARLATGSQDKTALLWDVERGELIGRLEGHTGAIYCVAFDPTGTRLITCSGDESVRVWDAHTGTLQHVLKGRDWWMWQGCFSPDGSRIAAIAKQGTAYVWNASSGELVDTLRGHAGLGEAVLFLDNRTVMTGSADRTARVWEVGRAPFTRAFSGHEAAVVRCRFSTDGRRIIIGWSDGVARVFAAESGTLVATVTREGSDLRDADLSADGSQSVLAYGDGSVVIRSLESGLDLATLNTSQSPAIRAAFLGRTDRLFVLSKDGTHAVWDVTASSPIWQARHSGGLWDAAVNKNGERAILLNVVGPSSIISLTDGTQLQEVPVGEPDGPEGHRDAAWFPDGNRLALVTGNGLNGTALRVWDRRLGRVVLRIDPQSYDVRGVSVSPDGKRIALGEREGIVRIWDAATGNELVAIDAHADDRNRVSATAFSPDGLSLLTASLAGNAFLWEAMPRDLLRRPGEQQPDWRERLSAWQRARYDAWRTAVMRDTPAPSD